MGKSQSSSSALMNSRVDSSDAVKAAMEASEKYGATSPEARVLWEVVEEMDASGRQSEAVKGSLEDECEINEDASITEACADYDEKMDELASLVSEYAPALDKLKELTKDLSNMKIGPSSSSSRKGDSPELKAAIAEFGVDSSEAKLAWETVEEVASYGLGNA